MLEDENPSHSAKSGDVPRHVHGRVLDTVHDTGDGIRMNRGIGNVARAHCLEQGLAFLATDLAHDDVLRPLTHCSTQEFVHVNLAPAGRVERVPRDTGDPVRVRELHFPGIFKGDDLRHRRDEKGDRVEGRGLTGCSPAGKDCGLPVLDSTARCTQSRAGRRCATR